MEYKWCEHCKSYQYGLTSTGGFVCNKCDKTTIYNRFKNYDLYCITTAGSVGKI
jgi:hypothetical protein